MRTSRTARSSARRLTRGRKLRAKRAAKAAAKPLVKVRAVPQPPQQVLYRMCRAGWSVIVEKTPAALGTRFVCPFCPRSHRVPGPVRGFRKVRRAQWIKLRRVAE